MQTKHLEQREYYRHSSTPYDALAAEYYDNELHVTSRNFDETTSLALNHLGLRSLLPGTGLVLDVGAGRGRAHEYLGVSPSRIVQLDSSIEMLKLEPREGSLVRILHDAKALPFVDSQFACVAAFLCDCFIGSSFFGEGYRVLREEGVLVGTTPTREWGETLRAALKLDLDSTRFLTKHGETVVVPSILVTEEQLRSLLISTGFRADDIFITGHSIPREVKKISKDIQLPAERLGRGAHDLAVLYTFVARKR